MDVTFVMIFATDNLDGIEDFILRGDAAFDDARGQKDAVGDFGAL